MLNVDRRYLLAASIVILVLIFALGTKYGEMRQRHIGMEPLAVQTATIDPQQPAEGELQVYICGEVEKPGLYKLKSGARVYDALQLAGILPGAALDYAQPARKLQDGETIELLSAAEIEEQMLSGQLPPPTAEQVLSSAVPTGGLVNINTATAQELDERLPGIGPALAARIIDYRESNGSFAQVEDLKNVSGIGDKKFADMKELISVR